MNTFHKNISIVVRFNNANFIPAGEEPSYEALEDRTTATVDSGSVRSMGR